MGLFARNRERIGRGGSVGKGGRVRVFLAKPPFFFPLSIQNREEGGRGMAGRLGCPPAAPAAATAGDKGKRERGRGGPIPVLTSGYRARWRRLYGRAVARRRC
jgi:hypothetical protein